MATSSAIKAGEAFVQLYADDSRLQKGLKKTRYKLKQWGRSLQAAGMQAIGLGAAIGAAFTPAVMAASRFEEQMSKVETMLSGMESDVQNKWMSRYREGIKRLAKEHGIATKKLADGLYDVLSAQIDVADAMGFVEAGSRAAVAGATDMDTSMSALITTMNAYGDELDDVNDASDFLFSIVKRGRLTFEELASNMGSVAPVASAMNVDMEEFGATLALITRGMPNVDKATTALANTIETFMKNTEEGVKAAEKLGISMSAAELKTMGLADVLERLGETDVTREDLADIFPRRRALRGLVIAVQKVKELGVDLKTVIERGGMTQEFFQKLTNTPLRKFYRIWQSIVAEARKIGTAVMPTVMSLGKTIQDLTGWLGNAAKHNQDLVRTLGNLSAILVGGGGVLFALGTLTAGIAQLGALLTPAGGVVAGVVALAGGLWKLHDILTLSQSEMSHTIDSLEKLTKRADSLVSVYQRLAQKEEKTVTEKERLRRVTQNLIDLYPELQGQLDGTAGSVDNLKNSLSDLNEAQGYELLRKTKQPLKDQQKLLSDAESDYAVAKRTLGVESYEEFNKIAANMEGTPEEIRSKAVGAVLERKRAGKLSTWEKTHMEDVYQMEAMKYMPTGMMDNRTANKMAAMIIDQHDPDAYQDAVADLEDYHQTVTKARQELIRLKQLVNETRMDLGMGPKYALKHWMEAGSVLDNAFDKAKDKAVETFDAAKGKASQYYGAIFGRAKKSREKRTKLEEDAEERLYKAKLELIENRYKREKKRINDAYKERIKKARQAQNTGAVKKLKKARAAEIEKAQRKRDERKQREAKKQKRRRIQQEKDIATERAKMIDDEAKRRRAIFEARYKAAKKKWALRDDMSEKEKKRLEKIWEIRRKIMEQERKNMEPEIEDDEQLPGLSASRTGGTYGGFGVARRVEGGQVQQKQLTALEEIDRNTRKTEQNTREGSVIGL